MQRVLTVDLWEEARRLAKKASVRRAAIAYVTRDLIGFCRGDQLVVDASRRAIASAETDAKLLRTLWRRGVELYHCENLHAKVLLIGETAIIGSGNMSASSADTLVEAGIVTDHASTVSGVASLIQQLVQRAEPLTEKRIAALCAIKVIRRGQGRNALRKKRRPVVSQLGNRTWLVGVKEIAADPSPEEQRMIDKAENEIGGETEDLSWVRWYARAAIARECKAGDQLIRIWTSARAKRPSVVCRATPVLLVQRTRSWARCYFRPRTDQNAELRWGPFQRLLKGLDYPRRIGPNVAHVIDPELADAIARGWNRAVQSG